MKQVDSVYDLIFRNLKNKIFFFNFCTITDLKYLPPNTKSDKNDKSYQQIDHPKVLLQTVTNKANSCVDEETQLQVCRLQCGQVL